MHTPAIQYTDCVMDETQANEQLAGLSLQDGYMGGRVLPPSETRQMCAWMIQAFFVDDTPEITRVDDPLKAWLPNGMRRVLILDSQRKALGIMEPA